MSAVACENMLDSDKLLVLLDSAESEGVPASESRLHYYVFFAKEAGVPFAYNFHILRNLYSAAIHEDLSTLEEGRYIEYGSNFRLTEKGLSWLKRFPPEATEPVRNPIVEILRQYADQNELSLFRNAYAIITKGI